MLNFPSLTAEALEEATMRAGRTDRMEAFVFIMERCIL